MDRLIGLLRYAYPARCRTGAAALRLIFWALLAGGAATLAGGAATPTLCQGEEAQWIWYPGHKKGQVPSESCYFRKSFILQAPVEGQITIAADDAYELYLNGRMVGSGEYQKNLKQYDITPYLTRGRNTVAVRVANLEGATAALAARVMVRQNPGQWSSFSSDPSWKTALRPLPLWKTALYNDRRWQPAQAFGALGETAPWDRREEVAVEERHRSERFQIDEEFAVQRVAAGEQTGSLIAMTFNEFGHVVASREGGPLLLLFDSNEDGQLDQVRVYCEEVKNCQGILCLNGEVYVTADGPEGSGLYRLTDSDRNGRLDQIRQLIAFSGEMGEHGAHGVTLGSDGLIYVVVGNHSRPKNGYDKSSPHRDYYEGDLVGPRYEDPGGHAAGMKAPGGVVLRTDIEGRSVELVAGGLRNAYDLAFNREGELFVHDSDMESDIGTTWYRPTKVFHVTAGAEFGWRSGWSKWPTYFVDSLPSILDTGRGSPTGAVVYDHYQFPARYHNTLFLADWSEGRILATRLKPQGSSFQADTEVFLRGQPLNVSDLEVGPDGGLYFCTGGRGTSGGIYRVSWRGRVPRQVSDLGKGVSEIIRQPQLHSAWARQKIAGLKEKLDPQWGQLLRGVALSDENPAEYRTRALDVMQLFGPTPDTELLITLAQAKSETVRSKAVELMGLNGDTKARDVLVNLLEDSDRSVRRKSCEALLRAGMSAPVEKLIPLLKSDDRSEAWAARRLLERIPSYRWRDIVMSSKNHRLLVQGALALMIADPSPTHAEAVCERILLVMEDFVSDRDFIDMLRVLQVALMRGNLTPDSVPRLRHALTREYPSGDVIMNRELVRLLVYFQVDSILDRYLEQLASNVPEAEKLHVAFHLRFLKRGWTSEQRLQVVKFFEHAQTIQAGNSFTAYVNNITRDFTKTMTNGEGRSLLADGVELPNAAVAALYKLPELLDDDLREEIQQLDEQIADRPGEAYERLRIGIVAVLSRSGDEASLAYLREIWNRYPSRREAAAIGLAQHPGGENWQYLVRSLPILEGEVAVEVLQKLASVDQQPHEPEDFRQAILCGLRLKEEGWQEAVALLEQWTGEQHSAGAEDWQEALSGWQDWFAETYREHTPAVLPVAKEDSKWQLAQLLEFLKGDEGRAGSTESGALVFTKAQCAKCHRYGDSGENMGPDLTSVSRRFTKQEILQSILFPSHVIPSQYATRVVLTSDGRSFAGLVGAGAEGEKVVLQADGRKVTISEDNIDEIVPSRVSAMPDGLLDELSLEEIADLFAYLGRMPSASVTRRAEPAEIK